jgi:hypothetical protein
VSGETLVEAVNVTRGTTLGSRIVWAGTGPERRRGLLGRAGLEPGEGIYLVPCQWVHMFGMKFAIDVAFLAGDGRVLALQRNLRPNRLSRPVFRAEGVLELPLGRLEETRTEAGDHIEFRDLP